MLLALSLPSIPTGGASLSVVSFGDFEVTVDDAQVDGGAWESSNAKWMLAYLLCQQRPVSEEELSQLFWPGSPPDKAHRCLLSTVHRLRKALGRSEIIVRGSGNYALAEEVSLDFDVIVFAQSFARGKSFLKRGERRQALRCFEEMQGLYRGPFLSDCQDVWCSEKRALLEDQLIVSLSLGANCHLPGNVARAEELCRQGLTINRGAEALWWTLMQCRYLAGDLEGVRRTYIRARAAIKEKTGAAPSALLSSLYERMNL